jgi:copper homeostasis protein
MLLEVACFNLESCLIAQKAGAKRIELCQNYLAGGITADETTILEARKQLNIDLFIMIRPREGNFIYSEIEFEEMKSQIEFCKELECDGVVFGILTEENEVDIGRCKELVELAEPMGCTFHRAFDIVENSEQALEDCITSGFTRILTSGKHKTANEGIANLRILIQKAQNRIKIIPGGGIRFSNISELLNKTDATEFHTAAITNQSEMADETEIRKLIAFF